nr:vWFA superfamily protein [Oceanusvirus sp.]
MAATANDNTATATATATATENGAYGGSLSHCLSLFCEPTRTMERDRFDQILVGALFENPGLAMQIVFHARDARNGKGEKRLSRWAMEHLAAFHPQTYQANLEGFAEQYGCYKDLCELYAADFERNASDADETPLLVLADALERGVPLAAKWAPSEKSHFDSPQRGRQAAFLKKVLDKSSKEYRQMLTRGREKANIVERLMSAGKWQDIDFSGVCAKAMRIYAKKAFPARCSERFGEWKHDVRTSVAAVKTAGLEVHDLLSGDISDTDEIQFNAIAQTVAESGKKRILPLIDVSASMKMMPIDKRLTAMDVAISLGILTARVSSFGPVCMTFHSEPSLVELDTSASLAEQRHAVANMPWGRNTDFVKALTVPLRHAIRNSIPPERFPTTIVVFSDMEFDAAGNFRVCGEHEGPRITPHEAVRGMYESHGYPLPKILYWNIANRSSAMPVQDLDENTALVSGFSHALLEFFLRFDDSGEAFKPERFMKDAVKDYDPVIVRDETGMLL